MPARAVAALTAVKLTSVKVGVRGGAAQCRMSTFFQTGSLPEPLAGLATLALDLRWSWNHAADRLWRGLDARLWERESNPWMLLQSVSQERLETLARDQDFVTQLSQLLAERERYLQEPAWYAAAQGTDGPAGIAYFSLEFGISEALPLYAGGLGVLAGDYLKSASDLGLPVVGIGLLYREGYFRQLIDPQGRQQESYPGNDPWQLPLRPVAEADGSPLTIELPLPGRTVRLRVWQVEVGRVRLYLLDSNDPFNAPQDRGITAKLYSGGQEPRLQQEYVLGVGGSKLLEVLGIEPEIYHLNEGHSAFAVLERSVILAQKHGLDFREAWWVARAGNVFTTHTAVDAAFDRFAPELVRKYARAYTQFSDLALHELLGLGRADPDDDAEPCNMAYLALRGCAHTNAVSRQHGDVSRALFARLFPRWPLDEVPIGHVTNGVHVPSWDSREADALWTQSCGKARWKGDAADLHEPLCELSASRLWEFAGARRASLVRHVRQVLGAQRGLRGDTQQHIAEAAEVLDPNALTLGFARRFTAYKRPNLLLREPERLQRLLLDATRPVQLVVAGKAHPDDTEGKHLIEQWQQFTHRSGVRDRVVFLADYDLGIAAQLVQGVDLWINTPSRPYEACGTSGMKVLVNGGLNLSVLDGWWAEAYTPEVGWAIDGDGDALDAETLYRLLENEVVPAFYERDADGIPQAWVARMRASLSQLTPAYSSNRMLRDYVEQLYRPAATAYRRRLADGAVLAHELQAWSEALQRHWDHVHFGEVEARREGEDWLFHVPVYLGDLSPDSVRVELCALPGVCLAMQRESAITGAAHGYIYSVRVDAERPQDDYTARVRPWHAEAVLPSECGLIAWQR